MGEEAKQEETHDKVETKAEEAAPPAEEKKEEEPSPLVLSVELHCVGCANKIEKSLLRIRGVEGVVIDMGQNQLTIKGVVEHEVVCSKILKKTKRRAVIVSPQPIPQIVASQISTVELTVNMHCEACALQLKKKILKMRGVQTVETELTTGKVMVRGTMDGEKLVDYVYRRTKKQAKIVPQPDPEPEEKKEEEAKPAEEKKEEETTPAPVEETKKEEGGGGEEKKEGEIMNMNMNLNRGNPMMICEDEDSMRRMTYYYHPLYVIDPIPPAPQLFSDENPNACSIS